MELSHLFEPYNNLVTKADRSFQRIEADFPECVKCHLHCSDCCHALFGLFLIEAVFLKHDFDQLDDAEKKEVLLRADEADKALTKMTERLKTFENDPQMNTYSMAKTRIRCPLLTDGDECVLYPYRPITCRVYGIPTLVSGVSRVCGKAGFKKKQSYPFYNLDDVHRELYQLSKELLEQVGTKDPEEGASLLISVSKTITTPIDELIKISSTI